MNTAKQTALDLDYRPRNPAVHEHQTNFTAMEIGVMAGDECRVLRCPACARNCIAVERARGWRFIHHATIQSTTRRVKFVPSVYCELDHDDIRKLTESGHIIRNRFGQILEIKETTQ